ncbi:protein translocase subunit secG [Nitrosospira sp. Nsp14]|uniref:preprotein translocase subunit SecG n=1 Tax=Nitrosospira sp. Nsp14 TaxID=1855333 RepID=UPI0008F05F55|nr:preprotein translocase subunit SecG [Nitrosospira sp. Nsp14]SFH27174.1 protein translocase subunit secG [Nitrosospira sp. Nsp14]
METFIWIVHVLSAVSVVVLVLLQHGKGADMGAAFGSGSSGSLFGASGSANFLSRTTGALAAVFFVTSLGLTYLSTNKTESGGVMEKATQVKSKPVEPAPSRPAEEGTSKATEIPK